MDSQSIQTRALIANGGVMPETLLGSDTQIGLLSPGVVSRELARWTVATASAINEEGVTQALAANNQPPSEWGMQVVAAIDNRTTETCLGAHAQVQPLGMPFELHGDPWESAKNYGFSNMQPPFHWFCRDALALVKLDAANDDLTRIMRSAASVELEARAAGDTTPFSGPTNAGSVRPSQRDKLRRVVLGG